MKKFVYERAGIDSRAKIDVVMTRTETRVALLYQSDMPPYTLKHLRAPGISGGPFAFEPESLSHKHTPRHDANGESMSTVIPLYTLHAGLLPGHRHSSQRVAIGPFNAANRTLY